MVRADAEGTDSAAMDPPAARAAVSSRRRAMTRRRSKAASAIGRGSSSARTGRATTAWTNHGRDAAADDPSAVTSTGTVRQATIGRPASANVSSTRARARRLAARPRGRKSETTAGRPAASASPAISRRIEPSSGSATPAPSLDSPSAPNAPRWPSAARPARASGRTRSRECPPASATNPTPQASCSKRASYNGATLRRWRWVRGGSMACLREGDGPAAIDERSTAAGLIVCDGEAGEAAAGSHLIGDLAVDGAIEAHRLDIRLDPDPKEDIDDLDDHERAHDGVPDGRADGDELDADLCRVAVEEAGIGGLDRRRGEDPGRDGAEHAADAVDREDVERVID